MTAQLIQFCPSLQLLQPGTPERCEGKGGGRFSWKGTFELIYTKRCLQNIGSWTFPNHVFYLLDDRGVRRFSARRLCYSWGSMTAFLAFSEANSLKNCTNISDNSLFRHGNPFNWKGPFAPPAPPGKGQRGRLPLLPPPPQRFFESIALKGYLTQRWMAITVSILQKNLRSVWP
jgi:hypothetical protein